MYLLKIHFENLNQVVCETCPLVRRRCRCRIRQGQQQMRENRVSSADALSAFPSASAASASLTCFSPPYFIPGFRCPFSPKLSHLLALDGSTCHREGVDDVTAAQSPTQRRQLRVRSMAPQLHTYTYVEKVPLEGVYSVSKQCYVSWRLPSL